jgi:DNA-binding IclR family transcriptional regulator
MRSGRVATHTLRGAQSLEKGLRVLRDIAASGAWGRRLAQIQQSTGLTKTTAHRIAQTLVRHQFAFYDRNSRRYFVGPEISILSVSAPNDISDLQEIARDDLRTLARETGDTAYLMIRSGNDVVCIAREMGPYPIKALTGEIGMRRPLGVGAAGIALLASLNPDEADSVRRANRNRLRRFPNASEKAVTSAVAAARANGLSYSDGLVIDAVRGVGLAVRDGDGGVVAALSVAAIRERMTDAHRANLMRALNKAGSSLERRLRNRRDQATERAATFHPNATD